MFPSFEVKQNHLGSFLADVFNLEFVRQPRDKDTVSLLEVDCGTSPRVFDPDFAISSHHVVNVQPTVLAKGRVLDGFALVEQRGFHVKVRVDLERHVLARRRLGGVKVVGCQQQSELVFLDGVGEVAGLVARLGNLDPRLSPDLEEVNGLALMNVELGVANTGSRRGELYIATGKDFAVSERVPVLEFAADEVRPDFIGVVRVGTETFQRVDPVFVEHPESTKVGPLGVVVGSERKSVIAIKPSVVGVATSSRGPCYKDRGSCRCGGRCGRSSRRHSFGR